MRQGFRAFLGKSWAKVSCSLKRLASPTPKSVVLVAAAAHAKESACSLRPISAWPRIHVMSDIRTSLLQWLLVIS